MTSNLSTESISSSFCGLRTRSFLHLPRSFSADNAVAAFTAEDMAVIGDVSINTLKAMEKDAKKGTERTEGKGEKQ